MKSLSRMLVVRSFAAALALQAGAAGLLADDDVQDDVFDCEGQGAAYGYNVAGFCYYPVAPRPYCYGPSCCWAPLHYRQFAPGVFPSPGRQPVGASWYRADPVNCGYVGTGFAGALTAAPVEADGDGTAQ